MSTAFAVIYAAVCIWALVRLCRSSFSIKTKVIWALVITLLPLGAFLSLANKPGKKRVLKYTTSAYALVIASSLCLYGLGFRWYRVPSASMEPTIMRGEHVIGRLDATYAEKVRRFDIVFYYRPQEPGTVFVSRVVGLPGDHVVIRADVLSVNDQMVRTLSHRNYPGPKECDVHLGDDTFFVLGDYEENSMDSRILGPLPVANLAGHLVFRK